MARYRLTPLAKADLADIRDYIRRDNPRAARKIVLELRARCQTLAERPGIGTVREE
jgi:toxin ParE1/3/4